ncbi:MAG TPA: response regulator [Herpetosiphonaceae bacterium]
MKPQLLIIEDDPAIRQMLDSALTFAGYPVAATHDARHALAMLPALAPALVLCDMLMAGMTGLEFCAELAALPGLQQPPVILMSGLEEMRPEAAGRAAGFLAKPFDLSTLFAIVDRTLAAREASAS